MTLGPKSWANRLNSLPERLSSFDNSNYFKEDLLKSLYDRLWLDALNKKSKKPSSIIDKPESDHNKLDTLKIVKSKFVMEPYITMLPFAARRDFARLRTSCHALEIEVGRYRDVPRHERICKLCTMGCVEDEAHFLVSCPYFKDARKDIYSKFQDLIPFELNETQSCFHKLFSCHEGYPPTIKLACSLAKSLTELRRMFFTDSQPEIKVTITSSGRVSKPPDRYKAIL